MDPRGRQRGRIGPGGRQRERWGPGGGQKGKQGCLGQGPGASVPCAPTGQSSCWFHSVLWNCPNILIDTPSVFGCLLPFPQMRTRESHPQEECPAHSIVTCCQASTRHRRSSHRHLGDQTGRTTGQQLSVKAGPPLFSSKENSCWLLLHTTPSDVPGRTGIQLPAPGLFRVHSPLRHEPTEIWAVHLTSEVTLSV